LLPDTRKVAVFTNDQTAGQLAVAHDAARRLGLALHVVEFKRPPFDYEAGFVDAARANAACDQHEDCQSPRYQDHAIDAVARRPGHPMTILGRWRLRRAARARVGP